jgi:hypothetical protein
MWLQTWFMSGLLGGCGAAPDVVDSETITILFQSRVDGEIEPCG